MQPIEKVKKAYPDEHSLIVFHAQMYLEGKMRSRARLIEELNQLEELVNNPFVEGRQPKLWREAVGQMAALVAVVNTEVKNEP